MRFVEAPLKHTQTFDAEYQAVRLCEMRWNVTRRSDVQLLGCSGKLEAVGGSHG